VDRAGELADHQAAVGAHAGGVAALGAIEDVAGAQQARLDDLPKGMRGSDFLEPVTTISSAVAGITLAMRASATAA
jgi:hypothetical protein